VPIFDWKCSACGEEVLDKLSKLSDPPQSCPACGYDMSKQIASTFKIQRTEAWLTAGQRLN